MKTDQQKCNAHAHSMGGKTYRSVSKKYMFLHSCYTCPKIMLSLLPFSIFNQSVAINNLHLNQDLI